MRRAAIALIVLSIAPVPHAVAANGQAVAPAEHAVAANGQAVAPAEHAVAANGQAVTPAEHAVAANGQAVAPAEHAVDPLNETFVQETLGERADRLLTDCAAAGFSGAALIYADGIIVLNKAYGIADRGNGVPNTVTTRFPLGTLSEQFTAAAILRLEDLGKVATTDRLERYFPDGGGRPARATVQDLLADPAGGYGALAKIVEQVSGRSFEAFVTDELLVPARMLDSGFAPLPPGARAAGGYTGDRKALGTRVHFPTFPRGVRLFAGSVRSRAAALRPAPEPDYEKGVNGVFSTAADLFRWELALRGTALLSEDAKAKLFNPFTNERAYGWRFERISQGTPRLSATGGRPGIECGIYRYPDRGLVIVLLANNDMGWRDPIVRSIEGSSGGPRIDWIVTAVGVIVLYLVLQGALHRRVPDPVKRMRHRIFPSDRRKGGWQ
jgi:CubicO group peptidase (beta-lactamase class C family)